MERIRVTSKSEVIETGAAASVEDPTGVGDPGNGALNEINENSNTGQDIFKEVTEVSAEQHNTTFQKIPAPQISININRSEGEESQGEKG